MGTLDQQICCVNLKDLYTILLVKSGDSFSSSILLEGVHLYCYYYIIHEREACSSFKALDSSLHLLQFELNLLFSG